jgi:WD40 repeat protein
MIASCSYDLTVRLWNIEGKPICEPIRGHKKAIRLMDWSCVNSVAFSHDGQLIVSSGGGEDTTIRLWRANWRSWLNICCDRLRYHPVFKNPKTEIEKQACETCRKYVWNKLDPKLEKLKGL